MVNHRNDAITAREGICVVGNLNMDLLIRGVPQLPEWGQEVVGHEHQFFPAGQAGYLALGLAALGTPVSVVGVVGDDPEGTLIVEALRDAGACSAGVSRLTGEQTGLTVALVRPDGERAFASNIGCSGRLTDELLRDAMHVVERHRTVALVGLFMVSNLGFDAAHRFLAQCRRRGQSTMLDTGWDPADWPETTLIALRRMLREVDLFLPNLDEAQAITGQRTAEHALAALSDVCPGTVVIKCGAEGSISWHEGRTLRHPAIATTAIDAVGAGDVFDAGLLAALEREMPIEEALRHAHATASLYVSRPRDRYPTADQVSGHARNHSTETGAHQ
ncbi:carbohydrate kinase family protein [Ruicaihuangia caeni]|uniref:Carbohydrate kinase family protein n=1 Tax=Ruicaihuangia caeni TaxID=3042517 RepID=A0AAW6T7K9_9MICO|nr:carbohydrate kinase family protein [Klugiella sp. YN-L-19]MDI2099204.1 carbohydrate kinase family protein [Klugiella sp. YN-L-19]